MILNSVYDLREARSAQRVAKSELRREALAGKENRRVKKIPLFGAGS
jgi:hypothetical protein